jgi:membrane-bound lytic murein transglycosylase B
MSRLRLFAALLLASSASWADISQRPEVAAFIRDMVARHQLDAAELGKLFQQVEVQRKVIDAMDRPAESKPWRQYRKILLNEEHIQGGLEFWKRNRAFLEDAAQRYGVAPEMIVAIIGVESRYGQVLGNYRVVDALATLAFDYPRRADYFRKELENYLLLCREAGILPLQPKGSYAGAMGMPQFMPSSYRLYAVDLDGDHKSNIWTNPADAIASVANYFAHAGWQKGEPVALPATVKGEAYRSLPDPNSDYSIARLRQLGVETPNPLPDKTQARLLALEGDAGPEYWLALPNFQAVTHYNHSPLYAMAAFQLGKEILARRGGL